MLNPKRVLHFQGRMGKGGAESFMMNLYRKIDRKKIQFDFLIYDDFADVTDYNEEIKTLGGNIYIVTNPKKNLIKYMIEVNRLLNEHKFHIAHNEVYFGGGINLWLAKRNGIRQRIAHSHATSDGKKQNFLMNQLRKALHKLLMENATDFLAVSKEAGESLFQGYPYKIIHNGIDLSKYTREQTKSIRSVLKIPEDAFVVGNIGRLEEQKNQKYLITIFKELKKKQKNAKLLIVGEGTLRNELITQIKNLSLESDVYLLGNRDDVPDILNSIDVFAMTSLYEGLPMVGIEAQASQKKLVLSDTISPDTRLTPNVCFLSLKEDIDNWVVNILKKPYTNEITPKLMEYDTSYTLKQMTKIYNQLDDYKGAEK